MLENLKTEPETALTSRTITLLLAVALACSINILAESFDCYFGLMKMGSYWRALGPSTAIRTLAYNVASKIILRLEPPTPSSERFILLGFLPMILGVIYISTNSVGPFEAGQCTITFSSSDV